MKRIIGTVTTVCIILFLVVLCMMYGNHALTVQQSSTLKVLLTVCGFSIAYCFIVGELTQNYSQMDKLWSLLPIVYVWIIAFRGGLKARLVIFALIVTLWGIRLTMNFARKGAYRLRFWEGNEDYRWSIVRQFPVFQHDILWSLFNLLFISMYQNLLVLAITLPALACIGSTAPFGLVDFVAVLLSTGFLVLEAVADEYQWKFYQTRKQLLADGKSLSDLPAPYDLGFNTFGPWGYMRHPNYLGEQGIWMSLYLFAIGAGAASNGIFHFTMIGPLLLILLFIGSTELGESISMGKYPQYEDYTEQIHKYLPVKKYKLGQ